MIFNHANPELHAIGAKDDDDKIRADLVLGAFPRALEKVCEVGTFGANKYTDNGWLLVDDALERYKSALLRHYIADAKGEELDPETGISHLSHIAWNAMAILELSER